MFKNLEKGLDKTGKMVLMNSQKTNLDLLREI